MARFSRVASEVLTVLSASVLLLCGCDTPNGPGPIETPVVQSINPDFGPTIGGTEVTIRGLRFAEGATVTIGGRLATAVTVQSAGVIVARTPPASAAGSVSVAVATAAGTGSLVGGFRYDSLVNLPPVIETMTVTGPRSRQPPTFADLGDLVTLSASVTDAETPPDRLIYQWTASLGSITGQGSTVTWKAPSAASTPTSVQLTLRVTEEYGAGNQFRNEITRTTLVSLHDSARELGDAARRFLIEFSKPQTNQDWRDVMRDFDIDGRVCPVPSLIDDERKDVIYHYSNFFMHHYDVGPATTSVNFGQGCPVRNRPGDACISVPVLWDSTDLQNGVRALTIGTDYLAAAYSTVDSRWWLCSSDFPPSAQIQGHSFYRR